MGFRSKQLIFALVVICGCVEYDDREFRKRYIQDYAEGCTPFYQKSITHAESLMVDLHRPVDNRWGPTCLQTDQWLKDHGPEENGTH